MKTGSSGFSEDGLTAMAGSGVGVLAGVFVGSGIVDVSIAGGASSWQPIAVKHRKMNSRKSFV